MLLAGTRHRNHIKGLAELDRVKERHQPVGNKNWLDGERTVSVVTAKLSAWLPLSALACQTPHHL
jgi:hypothetical protein